MYYGTWPLITQHHNTYTFHSDSETCNHVRYSVVCVPLPLDSRIISLYQLWLVHLVLNYLS